MGTAIKHPVPDRVKPSFAIFDAQSWESECPDVKNYKWRLNPVWHRMLYSCTRMATVGVKGLMRMWPVSAMQRYADPVIRGATATTRSNYNDLMGHTIKRLSAEIIVVVLCCARICWKQNRDEWTDCCKTHRRLESRRKGGGCRAGGTLGQDKIKGKQWRKPHRLHSSARSPYLTTEQLQPWSARLQ